MGAVVPVPLITTAGDGAANIMVVADPIHTAANQELIHHPRQANVA